MRRIPVILLTLALAAPAAAAPPVRRVLENLSRGLRFEVKLTAIAQAPSDPRIIYVGSEHGRVHVSRDDGRSWEESTALTRRGGFYGAIRKQNTAYRGHGLGVGFGWSPGRISGLRLPADSNGISQNPDRPDDGTINPVRFFNTAGVTGFGSQFTRKSSSTSEVRATFDGFQAPGRSLGGAGGGVGGSDLAVGIRSGSPRLAYQVRRKRKWGIGINLQQTLALKAAPATAIWFFDVNPRDPDDVLAATADGLRRSRNGGYSWPLVLTGPTPAERSINHLARDPRNPDRIYAGTGRGLHVSIDGGENWEPLEHPFVVASDIRWVDFDRTRPDVFYVGATWGLLRTADGGKSFGLAYRSSWPAQSLVRQVHIDPHRPEKIWLATADGLMLSDDDGKTFERAGGLLFVGANVRCLSAGEVPGHMIAVTDTEVWETRDGGDNWQIALFGRVQWKISYARFDASRSEGMLVLTEAEVLRFAPPTRTRPVSEALVERYRRTIADEPSQGDVVTAALKRAGLYRPDLVGYRQGARWGALLPALSAVWARQQIDVGADRSQVLDTGAMLAERVTDRSGSRVNSGWMVWAKWDLAGLIFNRAEAPIARIGRTNSYAEWSLRSTVINSYQERRRLLYESFVDEERDPRAELMRALRIEELTAHLNVLTGGLFAPAPAL